MGCNCTSGAKISYSDGVATITDARGKQLSLPIADAATLAPVPDKYAGWVQVAWNGTTLQMRSHHWTEIKFQLDIIFASCCNP